MNNDIAVLIAEDNDGHATLIKKNLRRSGIANEIVLFKDGQAVIDFFEDEEESQRQKDGRGYLLLLDIRMPKVDGVEVLVWLKSKEDLKRIPVIMITTTDDPREIEKCHMLGCSHYIKKPIDYESFVGAINNLGLFLRIVEVPALRAVN